MLKVVTDVEMNSRQSISSFLQNWFSLPDSLHPDRFSRSEPVGRKISDEGLQSVIDCWCEFVFTIELKRVKKPKFDATGSFGNKTPTDPFPGYYIIWLDGSAGDGLALQLFDFLIKHLKPVYGTISSEEAYKKKHFVTHKITYPNGGTAVSEQYVGMDVNETLPGMHWVTYFGKWAIEKIGPQKFHNLPAFKKEHIGEGILIYAYDSIPSTDPESATIREEKLEQNLGSEKFFNKQKWKPLLH